MHRTTFIFFIGFISFAFVASAKNSQNPLDNKLALVGVIADSSKDKNSGIAVMQLIGPKKKVFVKKGTKFKVSSQIFEVVKIQGKEVHLKNRAGQNFLITLSGFSAYAESSKGGNYKVREDIFNAFEGSTYEDGSIPPPPPPPSEIEWYEEYNDGSVRRQNGDIPNYKKRRRKFNNNSGTNTIRDFSDLNNKNMDDNIEEIQIAPDSDFNWDL